MSQMAPTESPRPGIAAVWALITVFELKKASMGDRIRLPPMPTGLNYWKKYYLFVCFFFLCRALTHEGYVHAMHLSRNGQLTLARAGGGGVDATPMSFSWNGCQSGRIALKFCIVYEGSFAQPLVKKTAQVRSQSYDVIKGTASDRFFKEIGFSAM